MRSRQLQLGPADGPALLAAIAALRGGRRLLAAAAGTGAPAHLVGGAVRDLLLGLVPRELDVVVEGDPHPLIAALGGIATLHERFETANVELGDDGTVDVARSRAETYPAPGALPEVEPAPLAIDLHRRDITLNAIAIDLRTGAVTAGSSALEDLAARRLRVLHPQSFIDDPTRLWRLARYEARLGADWDPITALLAQSAVAAGALRQVSHERLAHELRLALGEPDPYSALAAAQRLGLGPHLELDAIRQDQTERLAGDAAEPFEIALAAFASGDPQLQLLLDRREERALLKATLQLRAPHGRGPRPGPLAGSAPGSAVYRRFAGLPVAAVAAAPDEAAAQRFLQELVHLTPAVNGDELLAAGVAPGPALGRGLAAARDAVLDGAVAADDRDAQLALALAAAC